ncbi:DUF4012 domain-containing protein [Pseudarthrobacter sp. C4D7]|uniref:DUF4012 domain-containing protein n=1 Tax=Pseudarthrobacter sp. C4D7 TaxID=2735268 RepID=UPI00158476A1|nr:DUF4012 domain-containing protein [Pseudarthrobacter sp. C4D7]NUT71236.1 DUF4012 domain-containing protein [Pseudarthrobacter sp. C4D7]
MDDQIVTKPSFSEVPSRSTRRDHRVKRRRLLRIGLPILALGVALGGSAAWLGFKVTSIKAHLEAAANLVPQLKEEIVSSKANLAEDTVSKLRDHTSAAKADTEDPIWTLASGIPWAGPNLTAISEVARSADDVATLGLSPLVSVYDSLNWESLMPSGSGANLEPIKAAAPSVSSSAYAVRVSWERLEAIQSENLLPQIVTPLNQATAELKQASDVLNVAADATNIAPSMLGSNGARNYLLVIQNNAETRASGGIPGALAVLTLDKGKLSLGQQSSAGELGVMSPVVAVDPQQQQIYSGRLGKYLQDVNLTPDFPTAASTAQTMWERKTGQRVDGVISIDPMVLSYILQSTGPVSVNGPELAGVKASGLPTVLTGENVVPTLLSDVYAKIKQPKMQDAYFAGVAKEVFSALSSGKGEAQSLINGLTRGTEEGRVLVWSANESEQSVISKYTLSGAISGPSVSPAQFGVYFNDGTGAKMDYYVKRTVKLIKECPADGYEQTTVRVTSTNTAPGDAATTLPAYVTGAGAFGIPPGTVQTNVVAYGPAQANVESAVVDGQKTPFAPYIHANRPVGVVAQQLAPGESKTVEFTFGKIVQHTEPNVVVTPTVQHVKDVILPSENASCDQGQ